MFDEEQNVCMSDMSNAKWCMQGTSKRIRFFLPNSQHRKRLSLTMAASGQIPRQKKKTPKVWNIHDENFEFTYAPPKPDGDPWNVLLKPLMEEDKIRCEAWKEEVNNLLIFAGLFSAVVTAFVIESYKTLQPDPNSAIIDLLSHITTRLDSPVNEVSPVTSADSFSPPPSSIRVNVLWFLSLILSLTTVLVGIITLQWLREYQSYPGLTPKQSLAVFRMRSEGMEKWYVWKIFTALPLLLQAALALFLLGVVDFLLALDNKVAIPVSVVIGLTLFFLAATTAFPTLQGLYLYLPFIFVRDLSKEPSQCPYKSPQSHVFRAIFSLGFYLFHHLFPGLRSIRQYLNSTFRDAIHYLYSVFNSISQRLDKLSRSTPGDIEYHDSLMNEGLQIRSNSRDFEYHQTDDHHVVPLILPTWRTKKWVDFDSAWLLLRDACANGMHDQNFGLNEHRLSSEKILPLFDSVQAILDTMHRTNRSHTEASYISAIYHTFSELSKLIVGWPNSYTGTGVLHRQNRFFYALWKDSEFFNYEDEYQLITHGWPENIKNLHCQNMKLFLTGNIFNKPLSNHLTELDILLANCWGETHSVNLISSNSLPPLPLHLQPEPLAQFNETAAQWQFSHVLMKFFKYAADDNLETGPKFLHVHHGVVEFLEQAAWVARWAMEDSVRYPSSDKAVGDEIDLREAYRAISIFIGEQLDRSISLPVPLNSDDGFLPEMSYFFYISAIYVRFLKDVNIYTEASLLDIGNIALPSMRRYKEKFPGGNRFLEGQFAGNDYDIQTQSYLVRFSKEWWAFLDDDLPTGPNPLLKATPQEVSQPQLTAAEISNSHTGPPEAFEGEEGNQAVGTYTANDVVIPIDID